MKKSILFIFSILVALSVASCVENRSSTDSRGTEIKGSRGQAASPLPSTEIAKPLVAQDQNMAPGGYYSKKSLFASGLHRRLAKEETGRVGNVFVPSEKEAEEAAKKFLQEHYRVVRMIW